MKWARIDSHREEIPLHMIPENVRAQDEEMQETEVQEVDKYFGAGSLVRIVEAPWNPKIPVVESWHSNKSVFRREREGRHA